MCGLKNRKTNISNFIEIRNIFVEKKEKEICNPFFYYANFVNIRHVTKGRKTKW